MYYDNSRVVPPNTSSRKRPRSNDDDNQAFMPTSKKLIDNKVRNMFPNSSSPTVDNVSHMRQNTCNVQMLHAHTDAAMSDIQTPIDDTYMTTVVHLYSPELSWSENPFYYHANRLLHEAHMQKLLRSCDEAV